MISLEGLKVPLKVRTRRQGDRFRPLGMNSSRKLKKFLLDRKVPKHLRDRIPLLVDLEGDIIWVGGIEISQKVSLKTGSQQRAYELSIVPIDNSGE
jgi:tRNA(Ile)-lysidine synthetase-like protein